ncbi:MAG: hypothetical protein II161_00050 [Erysipelotrichaceae bacterium]|nr:hypothetical protein [Erysipelotrichaceae bacterium]MBQ4252289.1 hypothetical protein [Erysipelotrichaceae bacterium]
MPQKNRNYSDPLDELLDKLTSGYYVDQSVNEFSSTVNDTVKNYQRARPNPSAARRTAYKEVKPKVIPSVDTATYESRYAQVTTCLNNIDFTGYSDEKIDGYKQAISRYLELIENNKMDLRPVEDQVNSDYLALRKQIKLSNAEPYLFGYYDASMMVKKVIFNSKLARLRELSNSLK